MLVPMPVQEIEACMLLVVVPRYGMPVPLQMWYQFPFCVYVGCPFCGLFPTVPVPLLVKVLLEVSVPVLAAILGCQCECCCRCTLNSSGHAVACSSICHNLPAAKLSNYPLSNKIIFSNVCSSVSVLCN